MNEHLPGWLWKVLWFYSAWFRYGGLLMAIFASAMLVMNAFASIQAGHVLVNGRPSTSFGDFALALGIPLLGVALGLSLFLLVPKVKPRAKLTR